MAVRAYGPGVFTPEDFAGVLRQYGETLDQPVIKGMRFGFGAAKRIAVGRFRRRGVGRRVFGKKGSGAMPLFKVMPIRRRGTAFVGGIEVRGLAALQEAGGATAPHVIRPATKKVLRFEGGRGGAMSMSQRPSPAFIGPVTPSRVRLTAPQAAFVGPGQAAFARIVRHPGGKLPRIPVVQDSIESAAQIMADRVQVEIVKHLDFLTGRVQGPVRPGRVA
jgi:hypothetical protein